MSALAWDPQEAVATVARPRLQLIEGGSASRPRPVTRSMMAGWAIALAAVLVWGGSIAGAGERPTHSVTVRAGQTLSEIAAAELPDVPVREAVVLLQQANALSGSTVSAGSSLVIPGH